MALGKRKPQQDELFIPRAKVAGGPGHPFYSKLNQVLAEAGFDQFLEQLCAPCSSAPPITRRGAGPAFRRGFISGWY